MIHTEGTDFTDFTTMNREEIRHHLTSAIGDDYLNDDDDREALVLKLEDLDAVSADEFWTIVSSVLDAEDSSDADAESKTESAKSNVVDYYEREEANLHLETAWVNGVELSAQVKRQVRSWINNREYIAKDDFWAEVERAAQRA